MKTGGGPGSNKQLSDTEDRLLNVISKIHLGDTEIFDTFPQPSTSALKVDEVNEDLVFVEDIPLVELETIHNYATKMEESANDSLLDQIQGEGEEEERRTEEGIYMYLFFN
ncbi:uncharacterized protein [Diabrotica undecimpunctata]|uniref:uncharacterized protein isoform X2 n=1 Tax=Diabrotica undecimpunctata TaxID=50387 RepID=UPI003B636209